MIKITFSCKYTGGLDEHTGEVLAAGFIREVPKKTYCDGPSSIGTPLENLYFDVEQCEEVLQHIIDHCEELKRRWAMRNTKTFIR